MPCASLVQHGLESLQNFEVECVKCCCLILSTETIDGILKSFAIIPESSYDIIFISGISAFLSFMTGCTRLRIKSLDKD